MIWLCQPLCLNRNSGVPKDTKERDDRSPTPIRHSGTPDSFAEQALSMVILAVTIYRRSRRR
jgi:hypothetical protein